MEVVKTERGVDPVVNKACAMLGKYYWDNKQDDAELFRVSFWIDVNGTRKNMRVEVSENDAD